MKNREQVFAAPSRRLRIHSDPRRKVFATLAVLLMIVLRLVALDSDAYARLTYSSALLTDEGFYIHNARNLVLYGTERVDEFNNALLMPTLHAVQVAVFRVFGVGAVQARLISVAASLLTLLIFFAALRRPFGLRVACFGVLFLGLDHVNLLYSRMALMDTPAALVLVAAFWAFTRAVDLTPRSPSQSPIERSTVRVPSLLRLVPRQGRGSSNSVQTQDSPFPVSVANGVGKGGGGLGLLCGVLLGAAYATRSLALLLFPVPLLALWGNRRALAAIYGGLTISLVIYAVWHYLPNRAEMARIGQYYLLHQLLPQSLLEVGQNIGTAFFDVRRGLFPYLLLHTPVQFLLAVGFALQSGKRNASASSRYLGWWLLIPMVLFCFVSYAPSRYYVLFLPAMAGLAALELERLWKLREEKREQAQSKTIGGFVAAALWMIINFAWLGDWLAHLHYSQRDTDRWLAQNLPPGSVLLGDAAPGVCLNNAFRAIPVLPGLCNDVQPLETFAPAPRYVMILAGQKNTDWWRERYPSVVSPENQFRFFARLVNFEVVIYCVPPMSSPES